jgi:fructose-1,6-bisphosphatase
MAAHNGRLPHRAPRNPIIRESAMPHNRTTFSKFIIEDERRRTDPDADLTALLNDIQTACKFIASAVSRGILERGGAASAEPRALRETACEIMLRECESGGKLCGMVYEGTERPHPVPPEYPRGRYLLVFDALDGAANWDVNVTVGTVFAVLRAPAAIEAPVAADFLLPGTQQVAAGYALYGPTSLLVTTMGDGVHGFTLDREIGAYTLTHPQMRIPPDTREIAIDASNERFWEPPVKHYVQECVDGGAGSRGDDFNMRWVDSFAVEVNRILMRGGLFIDPRETGGAAKRGRLRLLYEANPLAMIVEAAGGAASTGRERILDIVPDDLHARTPVILGSRNEVERLARLHAEYDRGEALTFKTPLFASRSLFRTV